MSVECKCGCGELIPRLIKGSTYRLRKFQTGHVHRGRKGDKGSNWKGGRRIQNGYYVVYQPDHPYAHEGCVYEHRLVMEKYLGRYLNHDEHVHHINGNKLDNKIENLKLLAPGEHMKLHYIVDMTDRQCTRCGTTKVRLSPYGRPYWRYLNDKLVCDSCCNKQKYKEKKLILSKNSTS